MKSLFNDVYPTIRRKMYGEPKQSKIVELIYILQKFATSYET